jgi:hypothetical protein
MYAEARAAREAAAKPRERRIRDAQIPASFTLERWSLQVSNPIASARSTIEWRTTRIAQAQERLGSKTRMQSPGRSPRVDESQQELIDARFPLGTPLNRPPESSLRPIPGRPNWFVDSRGIEHYVEPTRRK